MAAWKLRRALLTAAAAVLLGGAGVPAQAGNYMGNFDPVPFAGTYNIFVDDACLNSSSLDTNGSGWLPNGTCSMAMTSAFGTVNIASPAYSGVVSWNSFAGADLLGVLILEHRFVAPDTRLVLDTGESPDAPGIDFFIQFTSAQCGQGVNESPPCTFNPGAPSAPAEYLGLPFCTSCSFDSTVFLPAQLPANAPGNVFLYARPSAVPEPGTLALAAGALGAGWLARRRKKATE